MNRVAGRRIKFGIGVLLIIFGLLTCRHLAMNMFGPSSRTQVRKEDYVLFQAVFGRELPPNARIESVYYNRGGRQVPSMAFYSIRIDAKDLQGLLEKSQAVAVDEKNGQHPPFRIRIPSMLQQDLNDFDKFLEMPAYEINTPISPPSDPAFGNMAKTYFLVDQSTSPTLRLYVDSDPFIILFPASPTTKSPARKS